MAGLFDTLGTATRGIQATQQGLATTGHNIANADTPGYARQRSVQQATRPQSFESGTIGTGVEQVTVERIIDQFVGARLVAETARKSQLETESSIYSEVEAIVNEQGTGGLSAQLTAFFDSLDSLASSDTVGQPLERGDVLAFGQSLVDTINGYDTQLRALQSDADRAITAVIPGINDLAQQIAELNGEISVARVVSEPNDLLDQRDVLIQELAEKIDITYADEENGMVSVRIRGGLKLVNGQTASELVAVVTPSSPNPFDPTFSQVFYQGGGSFFDVTSTIEGGELGGLLEARESIVGGAIRDLDAFAYTLSERFNAEHQGGIGLVDGAGHDFFADLSLSQTTVDDAARNLTLSADIDPAQGGTTLNIATGTPPGTPAALSGDTTWVERLKGLRDGSVTQYLAGDATGAPTGSATTLGGRLGSLIGQIGQQARSASRSYEQQEAVLSAVQDRRDSVSGVSIDEEVAQLVKLQASFQANARVIATVQGLMQDLLDAI